MNFNFSRMTYVSVSVLSLSILSGCSNLGGEADLTNKASTKSNSNLYDNYYGSANKSNQNNLKVTRGQPIFKVTAPKRYVVKKGDTLWGISNKFLNNPSYWPEIWDVNQKVQNPHRIYPGDVLYIYEGGKIKIGESNGVITKSSGIITEKLVPKLRIERKGNGEPISTLSPFLVWPRVLDQKTIKDAPYIVNAKEANLLIERGQTVYVKNLSDRHPGGQYAIFHTGKQLKDPESGQEYGNEVVYTGFLEVDQPALNAEVATASVSESHREIRPGDRLLYIQDETHTLKAPIQIPDRKIRGSIISLFDAELISGQTQVVAINKGARDGIKAGYTLGIFAPGKTVNDPHGETKQKYFWDPVTPTTIALPPSRAATAIVYKVLDNISYALIKDSTQAVKKGYKIGNP